MILRVLAPALMWMSLGGIAPALPAEALTVEAGASCLDAETLAVHLEQWRGETPIPSGTRVFVHGDDTLATVVHFDVHVGDALAAERRFAEAPKDCADLHAIVSIAIAIALDDAPARRLVGVVDPPEMKDGPMDPVEGAQPEGPEQLQGPLEPQEPDQRPESEGREPRPEAEPRGGGSRLMLDIRGEGGFGRAPGFGGGGIIGLDASLAPRFDLRVAVDTTVGAPVQLAGGRVDTLLPAVEIAACFAGRTSRWRMRWCSGAGAGAVFARSSGLEQNGSTTLPWVALSTGGDARLRLGDRVGLVLGVDAAVSLVRPRLDVAHVEDGAAAVARVPYELVSGRISFGPSFVLP
jgi:hypothetical protein